MPCRKLQQEINKLKCSLNEEGEPGNESTQCCSETESDKGRLSDCASDSCGSPSFSPRLEMDPVGIESDDDALLSTLVQSGKAKKKLSQLASIGKSIIDPGHTKKDSSKDTCSSHHVGRKRVRVVLSDDDESGLSAKKLPNSSFDDLITSEKGVHSTIRIVGWLRNWNLVGFRKCSFLFLTGWMFPSRSNYL